MVLSLMVLLVRQKGGKGMLPSHDSQPIQVGDNIALNLAKKTGALIFDNPDATLRLHTQISFCRLLAIDACKLVILTLKPLAL